MLAIVYVYISSLKYLIFKCVIILLDYYCTCSIKRFHADDDGRQWLTCDVTLAKLFAHSNYQLIYRYDLETCTCTFAINIRILGVINGYNNICVGTPVRRWPATTVHGIVAVQCHDIVHTVR